MVIIGEVKNVSGIYLITNIVNGKVYVGSSVDIRKRMSAHKKSLDKNKHRNPYLQNAWNKYGDLNFSFSVIELVPDKNKLLEREQYWIESLNVCNREIGYNANPKADSPLGRKSSDETKLKISLNNPQKRPILQYNINGNLIKKWASLADISKELNINRMTLYNRIQKNYQFNDSYFIYEDTFNDYLLKEILSSNRTFETSVIVNQYDKNGNFIKTWESIALASKNLNINRSHISSCCKGKRKTTGGFKWSYAN